MRRTGRQGLIPTLISCLVFGLALGFSAPVAADPAAMTAREYKLYKDYLNALDDPRVQKMRPRQRLPKIARNFGVKLYVLKKAIAKGEKHAETLVEENEAAAKAALEKSKVGDLISSVELVEVDGVVIGYLSWKAKDKDHLTQDASYLAQAIGKVAPITDTWALWACMGKKKVWTGMIRPSAAARISGRIEEFAETRYLRLFEDVHNLFQGSPPVKPKRDPQSGEIVKDPETGEAVMEPDPNC